MVKFWYEINNQNIYYCSKAKFHLPGTTMAMANEIIIAIKTKDLTAILTYRLMYAERITKTDPSLARNCLLNEKRLPCVLFK